MSLFVLISHNEGSTTFERLADIQRIRARYMSIQRSESSAFIPTLNLLLRQRFYSEQVFNIIRVRIWWGARENQWETKKD